MDTERNISGTQIEQLIDDLTHEDSDRSTKAKTLLIEMGEDAVKCLIEALPRKSPRHSWIIIQILTHTHNVSAIPAVAECLYSESRAVQALAAQFLAGTNDQQAVAPLLKRLKSDADSSVSVWILQALGILGNPAAVEPISRIIKETDSAVIRYTGIEALGLIGDPGCMELIELYLDHENHHVRDRAQTALEKLANNDHNQAGSFK